MIDRQKIVTAIYVCSLGVFLSSLLKAAIPLLAFLIALLLLASLYYSLRPTLFSDKNGEFVIRVIDSDGTVSLKNMHLESEEAKNAFMYCYQLGPKEFRRFVRTQVEFRYMSDQDSLRELKDLFKD